MRIIAGDKGGFPILPPKGETTRPIPDRVKAALFSILGGSLPAVTAADFFSGTGSFGLEALSRGAARCVFFEKDREALRRLRANLESTGLSGRGTVWAGDLFRAPLPVPGHEAGSLRLVSFDPPYPLLAGGKSREQIRKLLAELPVSGWPADDAVYVIRHDRKMTVPMEGVPLAVTDVRHYGGMTLTFLAKPGAATWLSGSASTDEAEVPEGPVESDGAEPAADGDD
jgi:16S rRNA (guanine966-N2)-methyltransferase